MKATAVVSVLNEEQTSGAVVRLTHSPPVVEEVVAVDDVPTDDTVVLARRRREWYVSTQISDTKTGKENR
jgi:hypothetical protein